MPNLSTMAAPARSPAAETATLSHLITGFRNTQLVYVAAKLGLADRLHREGAQNATALAKSVGAEPQALYRLLRALASLGLLAELSDGCFALTRLGAKLRTGVPGSLHSLAVLYGEDWYWRVYGRMLRSVETGASAFDDVHGQKLFDHLRDHPAHAAQFQAAMTACSEQEAAAIIEAYEFDGFDSLADIGGGEGALVAALLRAHPALRALVFDLDSATGGARQLVDAADPTRRATCMTGDFFAGIPAGYDLYLLKSVLHNWNDKDAACILRNCRAAMGPKSRLLVIERVVPQSGQPSDAKLFDINMLVVMGGQERTAPEYRALLQAAGLELARVIPTASSLSVIEALPRPD